jgi:hypothetical protein
MEMKTIAATHSVVDCAIAAKLCFHFESVMICFASVAADVWPETQKSAQIVEI